MAQPAGGDEFSKTVVLLKKEDCERRNGEVFVPHPTEMAQIKRPAQGQYKTNVQFSKIMGKDMVRGKLQDSFGSTFDLMNARFSCAAVSQDSITFQFHGNPCVWDGQTIKKRIKGNSVLYIVMDYDQMDVSSGISPSDSDSSQDVTEMSSLLRWLRDNLHFDVKCNPNYSPLQGGGPCVFTFFPVLHSEVKSVLATFEGLGTQELDFSRRGWLGFFPASPTPQVVSVTLKSRHGIILGVTQVTYGTNLQQVVSYPSALKKFCEDYMSGNPCGNPSGNRSGNSGGETESFRTLGRNEPVQMLSLLVYVAAEIGAQQFIDIIFTSSARRAIYNDYKDNLTLPETIARDHGNEETANYLADVTKRFSEETTSDDECSQTIDWSELVKAAEAAEKQLDVTSEKDDKIEKDIPKETGYLGDIDTSSSESSGAQISDSDDDSSRTSKKELKNSQLDPPLFNPQATHRDAISHVDTLLKEVNKNLNGSYSSENPLNVTVLGDGCGFNEASLLTKELASRMAKLPQVKVTCLVPENSCSEIDKISAALDGVTIVEAKKQPGFDEPTDWLYFPPQDLKTDFVLGVGKVFGKIAQIFKELHRCKNIYITSTPLEEYAVLLEEKRILEKEIERHRNFNKNVGLCQTADLVVALGPKMYKELSRSLGYPKKDVFKLTPGILSKFSDVKHATDEQANFRMLMFGGGDPDTFEQEGLNTALKAVATLKDKSYHLLYVCAAEGKLEQIAYHICKFGVSKHQVIIRSSPESEEDLKRLFCEADLAIMPSSEQGFGMMALAALSSGLPVLVHEDSGFGEALKEVQLGTQSTVESEDANDWAEAIKKIRRKERRIRLEEAASLRSHYDAKYSWEEQCRDLVQMMLTMVTAQPDQSL